MPFTTEQIEALAEVCGDCETPNPFEILYEGERFAHLDDDGAELTLVGERVVMEKLGFDVRCHGRENYPQDWEYSITAWDFDTEFYPTLSQAIEAACIQYLNNR